MSKCMARMILALWAIVVLTGPNAPFAAEDEAALAGGATAALGVGDVLKLTVRNEPDLTAKVEVGQDGKVALPMVGGVPATGLSVAQLEQAVEKAYADGYLVKPEVTLVLLERRSRTVFVLGAAEKPGEYALEQGGTLLELLARCGGASENASTTIVVMRVKDTKGAASGAAEKAAEQPEGTTYRERLEVDRSKLLRGDWSQNITLQHRDVILFTPARTATEEVYLLGDIANPGAHPLSENLTFARLLASVGLSPKNDRSTVTVSRFTSGKVETKKYQVSDVLTGKDGTDVELADGDILTVEQATEIYYVIGEVKNPGAFRYGRAITVREAMIMAGWITSRGNVNKLRVTRKKGDKWVEEEIELTDQVKPGDVIEVKERWI